MRRQYFYWTYLVIAIVLTTYGGYSVIYNLANHKEVPILGWIFLILGGTLIVVFLILLVISLIQRKIRKSKEIIIEAEEVKEEPQLKEESIEEEIEIDDEPEEEEEKEDTVAYSKQDDVVYERVRPSRSYSGGSAYIKKVGYGPVLRVNNGEILDMRNNTYYRIEDHMVKQDGYGPAFEISNNRIRAAFGSYLYEISGGNVNKVYGGYFASISDGYIQVYDLSEKYEISGDLNLEQKLAVVALLFGKY